MGVTFIVNIGGIFSSGYACFHNYLIAQPLNISDVCVTKIASGWYTSCNIRISLFTFFGSKLMQINILKIYIIYEVRKP